MKRTLYFGISISFLLFGLVLNSHAQTEFSQHFQSSAMQASRDAANLNFAPITAHYQLDMSQINNSNCSECCCKLGMSTWCTKKDTCISGSMPGKCVKDLECKD